MGSCAGQGGKPPGSPASARGGGAGGSPHVARACPASRAGAGARTPAHRRPGAPLRSPELPALRQAARWLGPWPTQLSVLGPALLAPRPRLRAGAGGNKGTGTALFLVLGKSVRVAEVSSCPQLATARHTPGRGGAGWGGQGRPQRGAGAALQLVRWEVGKDGVFFPGLSDQDRQPLSQAPLQAHSCVPGPCHPSPPRCHLRTAAALTPAQGGPGPASLSPQAVLLV